MERLVDTDLTARAFTDDAGDAPPPRARTVVVGGGVVGASVAHHLTLLGDDDVLLLERNVLGSGTTWHAAGLVSSIRASPALTELAGYGVRTYARLGSDAHVDLAFNRCGSVVLARTPGRLDELRHTAALARRLDVPTHLVDPEKLVDLWPLAVPDGLVGVLHQPQDGHLNPGQAALGFAKLARRAGAAVREGVGVTDVLHRDGRVVGVRTSAGDVECERVVLAAGLWTRDLAARCGVTVPLYAAEHLHVRTEPLDGAVPELPVLRDLDGYLYVRHEQGRLLVGAFEPDGKPRSTGSISGEGFARFDPDWEHFAPVRAKAEERIPALRGATYDRFLNAPESFTPDAHFCLGETAELTGLFVAAGFNSQGIIYGPGAGKALAEWMTEGAPTFDASAVDVQRFARTQGNRRYLHRRTTEALGRLYAMHWPHLQPTTARDVRRTPLHDRLRDANACFGELAGWERAQWFAAPGVLPAYEYSYGRQNWFASVGEEHAAAREAVALFDLSSFAKVEVAGPESLAVVQQCCTTELDVAPGAIRYTLMLNDRGGIELDATVVRLSEQRFLVVTPAAAQTRTLARLRRLARGRAAAVFDATAGLATIAVMGPRSRELLQRVSPADWSDDAQPYLSAREVEVADGHALALRVSFVGELGYELYPTADQALNLYDALVSAGRDLGLRHAGYHALDSLRSEKGYRHLGHDIGPADDPFQAGLGFTVAMDKPGGFVGRAALLDRVGTPPSRRAAYVALDDPAAVLLHDESILLDGRPVGWVTSGSYGYTLGRACGLAYLSEHLTWEGGDRVAVMVDCAGRFEPAVVSRRPFYDPAGTRMRRPG